MLASGADIELGGTEFMLATDVEEPYIYMPQNLYPSESEISGADKKSADPNVLLWSYDNFIGGDGRKYFDKDQPSRWWTGNNNPRGFPGSITATPTRTQSSTITTGVTPTAGIFVTAGGNAWYFTGDQGYHSSDGATWTENTDVATELPASYQISSAASDGEYAYIAASDGTNRGIWRVTSTTVVDDFVTAHANAAGYKSIEVKDNFLYAWTGSFLLRYPLDASLPITHSQSTHRKFKVNAEGPTGTFFVDMTAADSALVFMRAYAGNTTLYEYRIDPQTGKPGGRSFWSLPMGFTGKKIAVNSGIIYVLGDYSDKIGLFGYSAVSRQPFFLGYVGEALGVDNVRFIAPSYGAQVLLGVDDGTTNFVYVYDAEDDAFSQLDEVAISSIGTMTAGATYKNRRVVAAFATTSTKINRWIPDTDTPAGSWDWDSAAWDFDYPHEEKLLLGIHVVQDPTIASGTVTVAYQLDEDGSWNSLTATSAGAKHTYIPVSTTSSTKKFRTLRTRMTGASGCRVFSITPRAYVNTKQEVWKLTLDLRSEPGTTRRPSSRSSRASKLRDSLRTLVSNGNVVEFKDGRRYPEKSDTVGTGYTSHSVIVEFPKDSIDSATEGRCEVILRSVSPTV